jgi:alpha-galactosidase
MTKLAFIGAGSFGFTRSLVKDILTFPALADTAKVVDRIVSEG